MPNIWIMPWHPLYQPHSHQGIHPSMLSHVDTFPHGDSCSNGMQPMFSHGLCNWSSQPTLRVLHNSYSCWHWLRPIFLCNPFVSWQPACAVISNAWNGPSGCVWYDEWPTKLPVEYLISLKSCDMQNSNSMFVALVYHLEQPIKWSLVHQMDNLAVCDIMGGPPSFHLSILHHWKAVICSFPTVYLICFLPLCISSSSLSSDLWCIKWTIWLFVIWWVVYHASWWVSYITGMLWYIAFQPYKTI